MITPQEPPQLSRTSRNSCPRQRLPEDTAGVACGLAWTEAGGECSSSKPPAEKGRRELTPYREHGRCDEGVGPGRLTLYQGQSRAARHTTTTVFDDLEMHIHVPQGAIPKDGPSAGITMAVAMISALTQKAGGQQDRHDRRDHADGQGPAHRRPQGKDACGAPGRYGAR